MFTVNPPAFADDVIVVEEGVDDPVLFYERATGRTVPFLITEPVIADEEVLVNFSTLNYESGDIIEELSFPEGLTFLEGFSHPNRGDHTLTQSIFLGYSGSSADWYWEAEAPPAVVVK